MGDVIPLKGVKTKKKQSKKILCSSGFHKWVVDNERRFDVKEGRLVTMFRCERCGLTKVEAC